MCESAIVTRTAKATKGAHIEYRTKEGTWTTDASNALQISEEDAKAIVRTLEQADRPPAVFAYDHKVISEQ